MCVIVIKNIADIRVKLVKLVFLSDALFIKGCVKKKKKSSNEILVQLKEKAVLSLTLLLSSFFTCLEEAGSKCGHLQSHLNFKALISPSDTWISFKKK
jgi:hypothetical protein